MDLLKEKQKEIVSKLLDLLKDKESHSFSEIANLLDITTDYTEKLLEWVCYKSNLVVEIPKTPENLYEISSNGEIIDIENLDFSELKIFEDDIKILQDPLLLHKIKQILDKEIVGEDRNKIHIFLITLTKNLGEENAQACYLIGPPSSGKSYILHRTITTLEDFYDEKDNPNGKILWLTRSSPHGLEYYCNKFKDMTGFILFVEEAPGYSEAQASIRPIFSEKGLKIIIAVSERGKIESKEVNVKGCPVFFTTSVNTIIEKQMSTRVWILQTNDSEDQTKKIKEFISKQNKYPNTNQNNDNDEKIKLKQLLRLLKRPNKVLIPFIEEIEFPTKQVRARRDFAKFKTLIQVSAYLHQYQRPWIELDGKKYLIATFADYYVAHSLVAEGLKALQYGIPENVLKLLDVCRAIAEDDKEEITSKKVAELTDYSQTTISIYLKNLVNAGLLTVKKEGRENHYFSAEKGADVSLLNIRQLASKFNEEKFEDYLSQFSNKPDLKYENIIGNIYDFLQGHTIKDYNIENNKEDSLSDTNKESNTLLKQDKVSDSTAKSFITLLTRGNNT